MARKNNLTAEQMRAVTEYIEANLHRTKFSLATVASVVGLSEFHFARLFKETTGESPHQYILKRRVERAKALLQRAHMSLSDIADAVGFADQSHMTREFKRATGLTPAEFRRRKRDDE